MPPYDQEPIEKIDTKAAKYGKMGMGFSPTEKSIIDYGETLWNLIGKPSLTPQGDIRTGNQSLTLPIGNDMTFQAERGQGLFGQGQRPDWNPDQSQQDLKFTLSKYF